MAVSHLPRRSHGRSALADSSDELLVAGRRKELVAVSEQAGNPSGAEGARLCGEGLEEAEGGAEVGGVCGG